MDQAKLKKRQSLKVIVSEAIMVLTVITTVVILAFVVSGYWINSDFEVERQGMLQIYSTPTGAYVDIDGKTSSWLQRTNTSKVLAAGEHTITLVKEGYDSWSKSINIKEGLLYRLHYPRLFLQDRKKETIHDIIGTTEAFVFDGGDTLLLYSSTQESLDLAVLESPSDADNESEHLSTVAPEWSLFELTSDAPSPKPVDYRTLYSFFEKPKNTATKKSDAELLKDFNPDIALTGAEKLIFSKFYDEQYLTILDGSAVVVYKKDIAEPIISTELSFTPEKSFAGHNGEFTIFYTGRQIATLDMESMSIIEWLVDGASFDWLDEDMIYSVSDGELFVYDYDGLNRRSLAHNVSERFPVIITHNKWLYYFSDDNLVREIISN